MRNWTTLKQYTDILFEYYEGIAKITINRPEVYNAFRPQTNHEILDALAYCRDTPAVRVVVLTGAGDKAFCSGGDQHYKSRGGYRDSDGTPRLNVLEIHKAIRSLVKPVIAMVNGYAIGGRQLRCRFRLELSCPLRGAEEGPRDMVPMPPVHSRRGSRNGYDKQGGAVRQTRRRGRGLVYDHYETQPLRNPHD